MPPANCSATVTTRCWYRCVPVPLDRCPACSDTVLNVGCTSAAVQRSARMTGHPRFAFDCRRRFLESFGSVVLGVDPAAFAMRLKELVAAEGVDSEQALDGEALERLAASYQQLIEDANHVLAENPMEQLRAAAEAVYRSWGSDRARTYRELRHFEDLRGTAVTVQAMVFGNSGLSSGAGVAFSRDPSTGADTPVVDVMFAGARRRRRFRAADSRDRSRPSFVSFPRLPRNCAKP